MARHSAALTSLCNYLRRLPPVERSGVRLTSDLDIMVMPDEAERAVAALGTVGYNIHDQAPPKVGGGVCRAKSSAGCRNHDLHRAAPGPAHLYFGFGHVLNHCVPSLLGREACTSRRRLFER